MNNNHPENTCLKCNSPNITYEENYGFKCNTCNYVWGYAQDDPDNDEYCGIPCPKCGSDKTAISDTSTTDILDETIEWINLSCNNCGHGWIKKI